MNPRTLLNLDSVENRKKNPDILQKALNFNDKTM